MKNTLHPSGTFEEGMMVSELIRTTSVNYVNELREKDLVNINRMGKMNFTTRGKIAKKIGLHNYLQLENAEREFLHEQIQSIRLENRGLLIIFGGMFISLVLIIAFWAVELKTF